MLAGKAPAQGLDEIYELIVVARWCSFIVLEHHESVNRASRTSRREFGIANAGPAGLLEEDEDSVEIVVGAVGVRHSGADGGREAARVVEDERAVGECNGVERLVA